MKKEKKVNNERAKKPIVGPWIDMKEYNKLKKENKALKKQLKEAITYIMLKAILEEEFEKITNNILEGKIKNEEGKCYKGIK